MRFSLPTLLEELNDEVTGELKRARVALGHPTDLGDASESIWIDLFNRHLPQRYLAIKAHVVDSRGTFSDQIDVVICDRQYTPLIFKLRGTLVVPVESVYAVFEAKQVLNAKHLRHAKEKAVSVRA